MIAPKHRIFGFPAKIRKIFEKIPETRPQNLFPPLKVETNFPNKLFFLINLLPIDCFVTIHVDKQRLQGYAGAKPTMNHFANNTKNSNSTQEQFFK
jgi:hypothetical protein